MITLEREANKNLKIILTDKEGLIEMLKNSQRENIDDILYDLLDVSRYTGNNYNWFCNLTIGLTEAPNIAYGAIYNDYGDSKSPMDYEEGWWYPNYQITSYLDELIEKGEVIFTYAWSYHYNQKLKGDIITSLDYITDSFTLELIKEKIDNIIG